MRLTVEKIEIGVKVEALSAKINVLKSAAIGNDSCRHPRDYNSRRLREAGFRRNLLDFAEVTILDVRREPSEE